MKSDADGATSARGTLHLATLYKVLVSGCQLVDRERTEERFRELAFSCVNNDDRERWAVGIDEFLKFLRKKMA